MRKHHARAANLAMQHNVHWCGHCMHALVSCHTTIAPAYTKLASSAARAVLPTTIQLITPTQCALLMPYRDLRCFTHGSPLERLYTRYSGSGNYKSSLYTSSSAEHEQYVNALQLVLSLRVVARCGTRRLANALMPSEGGKLSTRRNST